MTNFEKIKNMTVEEMAKCLKDYSLVCEVIHDYLYRTLKEMAGGEE